MLLSEWQINAKENGVAFLVSDVLTNILPVSYQKNRRRVFSAIKNIT